MRVDRMDWGSPTSVTSSDGAREGGAPFGEVTWRFGAHEVTARVQQIQGSLRATRFEVTGEGQVPPALRRLPSDTAVMQALRAHGNPGITTVAYLMEQEEELAAALQLEQAQASDSALERALERYMRKVNARPRIRIQQQVEDVRRMLTDGLSTKEIVEDLVTSGVSEATAYRRLKAARNV